MKYIAWILQVVLAVAFGFAGVMKLTQPRENLIANGMAWAEDFSVTQVRLIGAAEVAGAVGLIVPAAAGIAPILTPLAAAGLAVIMGGAVATHMRRGETVAPLVLGLLALLVAYLTYQRIKLVPRRQ